jgi:hypothetical protein
MNALPRFVMFAGGFVLSIATTLNAYGLTVVSWSWLIFGSLGSLLLIGLAKVDDR